MNIHTSQPRRPWRRIGLVAAASLALSGWCAQALAASPASGTLSASQPLITYTSGPFFVTNASYVASSQTGTAWQCSPAELFPCDDFALTVSLPDGYEKTHPYDSIVISTGYAATPEEDFDDYLFDSRGAQIASAHGPSTENPEVMTLPAKGGTATYTVEIMPSQAAGDGTTTTITLVHGSAPVNNPFRGIAPRYQTFTPPPGKGYDLSGEFSVGYNPNSGNIMALADLATYKITPPEKLSPALPESCEAEWTDVSGLSTSLHTLDPILWTDQSSGRTFVAQQTTGADLLFGYTDDDGANWTPASVAPPAGSADHETVATGPYPAASPIGTAANAAGFKYATYYCAQAEIPAFCQRSDNGGASFGPGVPIYTGITDNCSGIHGHVRVAPDGTVWVPNGRGCGAEQGAAVSTDAGNSWHTIQVPGSTNSAYFDPSVGLASDSTAYFCYVGNDGHPHVSVSRDGGTSWGNNHDIGAALGIKNAVFVEATAGDPDRAACGFIGTTTGGSNWQGLDFKGVWYLYIATTYDGGKTWATVQADPAPIQGAGGVCANGIACSSAPNNRNLLDFNEITHDESGRVIFGYDVGCVSDACRRNPQQNDFMANMRIARQTGGRTLFARFDRPEPALPGTACLAGTRTEKGTQLSWRAPDNGGAKIANYRVYRSTAAGQETLLGETGSGRTSFSDTTPADTVAKYYYRVAAVNSQGESPRSNEVALPLVQQAVGETMCHAPGITTSIGAQGSAQDKLAQHTVLSVQLAEPYVDQQPDKLLFTLGVASLSQIPPNTIYQVRFVTADETVHFVAYDTSTLPSPSFNYGHVTGGVAAATYTVDGTLDPESAVDVAGNRIVMLLPKSAIPALGDKTTLTGVVGEARLLAGVNSGAGAGVRYAVDYTGGGAYEQRGNAFCAPPPVAVLGVSPRAGTAPLTVSFDAGGSHVSVHNPQDQVVSYTFDFNDGSAPLTQATPTATHTYNAAANFKPTLRVTDSFGHLSSNAAFAVIPVMVLPDVPTKLSAKGYSAAAIVRWTPSANATGYSIYRGTSPGGEGAAPVLSVSGAATNNAKISGLSNGTIYYFTVKATNAAGSSPASTEVSATPLAPPLPPAGLTATPGKAAVTLSWSASSGATSYAVYQGTSPGAENPGAVVNVVSGSTAITIDKLSSGQLYYFVVKAANSSGVSKASNEASAQAQ